LAIFSVITGVVHNVYTSARPPNQIDTMIWHRGDIFMTKIRTATVKKFN